MNTRFVLGAAALLGVAAAASPAFADPNTAADPVAVTAPADKDVPQLAGEMLASTGGENAAPDAGGVDELTRRCRPERRGLGRLLIPVDVCRQVLSTVRGRRCQSVQVAAT